MLGLSEQPIKENYDFPPVGSRVNGTPIEVRVVILQVIYIDKFKSKLYYIHLSLNPFWVLSHV